MKKINLIKLLTTSALLGTASTQASIVLASYSLTNTLVPETLDASLASATDASMVGLSKVNTSWFDGGGRLEFQGMAVYPAKTDYVTITLTGADGSNIDLNGGGITFSGDYVNGSSTGDGYTVDLISDPSGSPITLTVGTGEDTNNLSFDSGEISGFTPANVVELRVYWNNGQSWGDTQMWDLEVTAVPEPSTYAAVLGLLSLGFAAWRRRC